MGIKEIGKYKFIEEIYENIYMYFSTAEGGMDFNKNSNEGIDNLNSIKEWFNVEQVSFLNQIHSDKVVIASNTIEEGDALISDETSRAIGVFTADCVPILIIDKKNRVIGAVHSGWRSTAKDIVIKTIEKMKEVYGSDEEFINIYIGPHIKECCFEVGDEVIDIFKKNINFKDCMVNNNKIDLQSYIIECLLKQGIKKENIFTQELCTYCCENTRLHSYRREKQGYGRMFSFIFIK